MAARLRHSAATGRSLITALRDDVRLTLLRAAIEKVATWVKAQAPGWEDVIQLALDIINRRIDGRSTGGSEMELAIAALSHTDLVDIVEPFLRDLPKADLSGLINTLQAVGKKRPELTGCESGRSFDAVKCRASIIAAAEAVPRGIVTWGLWEPKELLAYKAAALDPWLDAHPELVTAACGVYLAVGISKRCTTETCSVGKIADVIAAPDKWFKKGGAVIDTLCWKSDTAYRLAPDASALVDLAARAVDLVTGRGDSDPKTRLVSVALWLLDVADYYVAGHRQKTVMSAFTGALKALLDEDYLRAATAVFELAAKNDITVKVPERVLRLIGAVAAYARTYSDTEKLDAKEASQARKDALESLIDSATDRHDRGGDWVISLGAPVGYGFNSLRTYKTNPPAPLTSLDEVGYQREFATQIRLPVGLYLQLLPTKSSPFGLHVGMSFADLGQFLRSGVGGKKETVRWNDFVGIGGQLGFLLGTPSATFVFAFEVAWSPGLYPRTYQLTNADDPTSGTLSGALQIGGMVGFYVPFFDLN